MNLCHLCIKIVQTINNFYYSESLSVLAGSDGWKIPKLMSSVKQTIMVYLLKNKKSLYL